jgi:hypothetical protein
VSGYKRESLAAEAKPVVERKLISPPLPSLASASRATDVRERSCFSGGDNGRRSPNHSKI